MNTQYLREFKESHKTTLKLLYNERYLESLIEKIFFIVLIGLCSYFLFTSYSVTKADYPEYKELASDFVVQFISLYFIYCFVSHFTMRFLNIKRFGKKHILAKISSSVKASFHKEEGRTFKEVKSENTSYASMSFCISFVLTFALLTYKHKTEYPNFIQFENLMLLNYAAHFVVFNGLFFLGYLLILDRKYKSKECKNIKEFFKDRQNAVKSSRDLQDTIYEISHNEELMKEVNEKLEDRKLNEIEYQAINYLFKVIKDNEADYKKRLERKLDNLITIEKNTRIKDL
ncbi:MAG: hypothetical protein CL760_11050 [Chloroflexi bacterium]|nr:hypothetical protein [Chloroflexota bacterium]|tara:strand:+ start:8835 stop:9695 length:861 start_codon:yes stop_codon:yes gene_type:complete